MKTESSKTNERFRNYYITKGRERLSIALSENGFRRFLVYDAGRGGLGWLDVLGGSERAGDWGLRELRERAARMSRLGDRWLVPVREIGEDDGLLYVVRDVAEGEEIARYVGRHGQRLPLSDSLDLALEMAGIQEAFEGNSDLAEALAWREALVAPDERHRLRLRLESLPSSSLGGQSMAVDATGGAVGGGMRAVCDVLHFCLTGQWIAVDGGGQLRPRLGELPEEVRYLVWAQCQGRGGPGTDSLAGVIRALGEIKAQDCGRPVEGDRVPQSRVGRLLFEGVDIEGVFGRRFTRDAAGTSAGRVGTGAQAEPVVQQPFGYAMTLRVLPSASVIAETEYARQLQMIGEGGGRGEWGALRVCARASRGGVEYVVEENVNGASLEEIAWMRGGFEPAEALDLLGRVHETLTGLEVRGHAPWSLRASNCLLHFAARVPRGGERVLNENVAGWPDFVVVLRLHPTMTDLVEGRGHPADACGFAALFWHLVALGKRRGPLAADGTYRPLGRLREAGNAFVLGELAASPAGSAATGRAAFLGRARALAAAGGFEGPTGVPGSEDGMADVPAPWPGLSARPLLREPGRPVRARARTRTGLARLGCRAAVLAGSVGLAVGGAAAFLPSARQVAVDRIEDVLARSRPLATAGEAGPKADAAIVAADLVPVVLASARRNGQPRSAREGSPGCAPPAEREPATKEGLAGEMELVEALLRSLRATGQVEWNASGVDALRRAAAAGVPTALLCLGDTFDASGDPRAIDCYRESAVSGDPAGMRAYAECLFNGRGLAADVPEALLWFRKAGEAGDVEASRWLTEFEQVSATGGDVPGR